MIDQPIPDRAELPLDVLDQVDRACDRFEAAWRGGACPRLEEFLGEVAGPYRRALLRDLLAAEIDARRRLGESPRPDEYRERLPGDSAVIGLAFGALVRDPPGGEMAGTSGSSAPNEADVCVPTREVWGRPKPVEVASATLSPGIRIRYFGDSGWCLGIATSVCPGT